jgi:flavin reductase (DIM6/NTAB) family NADH-FMN oxidoreductase RutF
MAITVSASEFKSVMRHWPTGVAVVTTKYNEQLFGLTVNSFTSVSLSPPLVSFCLSKDSGSFAAFHLGDKFAINILAENQQELAKHFAAKKINKFLGVKYQESKLAMPLIIGATCWLECDKLYEYDGGDHIILVAKVQYCSINNKLMPLLYFEREYKMIK